MNNYIRLCNEMLSDPKDEMLKRLLTSKYNTSKDNLTIPIGVMDNDDIYMKLDNVHGIFIGGETGSGKSVFLDMMIVSLMLKNKPNRIKFMFFDPKKVELGEYDGIDYINNRYKNNISNSNKGLEKLIKILRIIEERTNILLNNRIKSIKTYNRNNKDKWPHIFIVIDESSDIMKIDNAQEVIEQILDYGKPVGIHVILATNTYLRNFYHTKFINHFRYRISFDMASHEQAKYIEIEGCDLLKDNGNGLIKCNDDRPLNFQAPYITDKAIKKTVKERGRITNK